MSDLYRKSALEKLSSPDQLDRLIVVTSPSFWLAILGAAFIILVALVWSIVGRLPITVNCNGIYISNEGMRTVYSDTAGVIATVEVEVGEAVEAGQVVATVTDSDSQAQIKQIRQRLEQVKAVTLLSTDDAVTSDTKDLLEIKRSLESTGYDAEQSSAGLAVWQEEYNTEKAVLDQLAAKVETAKKAYYAALDASSNGTHAQTEYQQAQEVYSAAASAATQARETAEKLSAQYAEFQTKLAELQARVDQAASEEEKVVAQAELDAFRSENASLESDVAAANQALSEAAAALSAAEQKLAEKKPAYEKYLASSADLQADLQKKQTEYSELSSQYASQQSIVSSLEQNIASAQAQIASQQMGADQQVQTLLDQFDATREAVIGSLEQELAQSEQALAKTRITAKQDGVVTEISVSAGSVIGQGGELMRMASNSGEQDNVVICYIPLADGKKVAPGMQVMVYPSTVNKQEYGHMEATVLTVDDYVTSTAQMKAMLGDDLLVNSFTQEGPVIAVTCELRTDETTASGYFWSSKKGTDISIAEGTLVTADIVTEEKAPIQMVIPLLKEFFSMKENER